MNSDASAAADNISVRGGDSMCAPTVSVVLPVYNRVQRVPRAIESLLTQSFGDFELIIVDDGSAQDTANALRAFASRDARIRLLTLPINGGQGLARALGNDAARGEFIAVMDSDDVALPHRLEKQVAFMAAHPAVTLSGAQAIKVSGAQRLQMQLPANDAEIKARLLLMDGAFVHPTVIMRTAFLRTHNLNYSAERRGDDDYEFYTRMVAAGAVFANCPETVLEYHRHGENMSGNWHRLERDKFPLRRYLLGLYYPDLTVREVNAIAGLMQRGATLARKQAFEGLLAAEKAQRMRERLYGEDHSALNAILERYLVVLRRELGVREVPQ